MRILRDVIEYECYLLDVYKFHMDGIRSAKTSASYTNKPTTL